MSLARQGLGTFAGRLLGFAAGLGASIILARALGPSGKGIYALAVLVAGLLLTFVHAGAGSAAVHHYGKRKLSLAEIVPALFWLSLVLGMASVGLYVVLSPWLLITVLRNVQPELALLAVSAVPLGILARYLNYVQLARNQIMGYNIVFVAPTLATLLGLGALMVAGELTAAGAVYVWVASQAVQCAVAAALALRGIPLSWRASRSAVRSLLSYGVRVQMVLIANQLHYRGDLLILGFFRPPSEVGLYTIAVGIGTMLAFLPGAVGVVLFRRVSASDETASTASAMACRMTLLIMVGAAAVMAAVVPWLVPLLYGREFIPSIVGIWALLPGIVGLGLFKVLGSDLMGRGRPGLVGTYSFITLAINVGVNLLLIPRYGFVGAALASTVSYSLLGFMALVSFVRQTGISPGEVLVPRLADARKALAGLRRTSPQHGEGAEL